jgi:hypothetical protein
MKPTRPSRGRSINRIVSEVALITKKTSPWRCPVATSDIAAPQTHDKKNLTISNQEFVIALAEWITVNEVKKNSTNSYRNVERVRKPNCYKFFRTELVIDLAWNPNMVNTVKELLSHSLIASLKLESSNLRQWRENSEQKASLRGKNYKNLFMIWQVHCTTEHRNIKNYTTWKSASGLWLSSVISTPD